MIPKSIPHKLSCTSFRIKGIFLHKREKIYVKETLLSCLNKERRMSGFSVKSKDFKKVERVSRSVMSDSVIPWTVARQVPLSIGILQARILEWVAISSSRGSSQSRDRTWVSCIEGRFFTIWIIRDFMTRNLFRFKIRQLLIFLPFCSLKI